MTHHIRCNLPKFRAPLKVDLWLVKPVANASRVATVFKLSPNAAAIAHATYAPFSFWFINKLVQHSGAVFIKVSR